MKSLVACAFFFAAVSPVALAEDGEMGPFESQAVCEAVRGSSEAQAELDQVCAPAAAQVTWGECSSTADGWVVGFTFTCG